MYIDFNICELVWISDCNIPTSPGYTFSYTDTTYEATASVVCATGYDGSPNPGNIACLDTENWTSVIGCNRKGMIRFAIHAFNIN